jgi:uncharacterized lipoprotein
MSFPRFVILSASTTLLCGCWSHIVSRLNPDCHVKQEYQHSIQVAALKVPEGLDAPNTQGALVIPDVELAPPPPGPKDACLDLPPKYKPAPQNKAASG